MRFLCALFAVLFAVHSTLMERNLKNSCEGWAGWREVFWWHEKCQYIRDSSK